MQPDAGQLVSGVARVRGRAAGVGDRLKIAVVVVRQRLITKRRLMIGRVVSRGRNRLRHSRTGKTPAGLDSVPVLVVFVGDGAESGRKGLRPLFPAQ